MNVLEELKSLAAGAQTQHVKDLLNAEVVKVETEAKAAVASIEAHVPTWSEEAKALWEKIKKML